MAAIGGANDQFSEAYAELSSSVETRTTFANNVVALIEQNSLSGIDLDWEFPSADNKNNFVLLLQEVRKAFDVMGYILSVAVAPDKWRANDFYDVPKISQEVDFINLMTYDFHGPWDSEVGHHSQIYPHHNESGYRKELNVAASVTYWLSKGALATKLVLGVPTYGNHFVLSNSSQHKIGSEINAKETKISRGNIGYDEYCATKNLGWKQRFDTNYRVYYAINDTSWLGFDSIRQVIRKSEFIKGNGLGGVMFWSLDTDDYSNDCSQGRFPLISAAALVLKS